jgi:hypothetical protein
MYVKIRHDKIKIKTCFVIVRNKNRILYSKNYVQLKIYFLVVINIIFTRN